jgi:hypothetical protein
MTRSYDEIQRALVLQRERDLVRGDGAFAEDHPGVGAAAEVDDGGGDGAGRGAAIDDERDLVAELITDAGSVGAFGKTVQIGGGCGDRKAEFLDDGAADLAFRHAQGDVAGVRGDAQRELAAGLDDDGERARPEALGQTVEGGVDVAGEFVGLRDVADEERKGLVARAGFELVDAVDGAEIDGVDGKAVEGVGGQRGDVAGVEAFGDMLDQCGLGFVWIDA